MIHIFNQNTLYCIALTNPQTYAFLSSPSYYYFLQQQSRNTLNTNAKPNPLESCPSFNNNLTIGPPAILPDNRTT